MQRQVWLLELWKEEEEITDLSSMVSEFIKIAEEKGAKLFISETFLYEQDYDKLDTK